MMSALGMLQEFVYAKIFLLIEGKQKLEWILLCILNLNNSGD